MSRPKIYAKHTGRRHKKFDEKDQIGLAVDVEWGVNVSHEFGIWIEERRRSGECTFMLEEFAEKAAAQPKEQNSWGAWAKGVLRRWPGVTVDGYARSKVPSAHRRLVNVYRIA